MVTWLIMVNNGDMMMILWGYTLWWTDIAIENGPVEIVDFPIKNGGSFHGKMLVHQRVSLPKKTKLVVFLRWCRAYGKPQKYTSPHSLFLSNIHSHPRAHLTWNTTDMFDSDPKIKNDGSCRSFPWSLSKPMGYLRISIILYRYPADGFNPYACVWTSPKNAWLGMLI